MSTESSAGRIANLLFAIGVFLDKSELSIGTMLEKTCVTTSVAPGLLMVPLGGYSPQVECIPVAYAELAPPSGTGVAIA